MVSMVIKEFKSISRLKILRETGPRKTKPGCFFHSLQVALSTFAVYVLISPDNVLTPTKAFVSLSLFNIINYPMSILPAVLMYGVQVTATRQLGDFVSLLSLLCYYSSIQGLLWLEFSSSYSQSLAHRYRTGSDHWFCRLTVVPAAPPPPPGAGAGPGGGGGRGGGGRGPRPPPRDELRGY